MDDQLCHDSAAFIAGMSLPSSNFSVAVAGHSAAPDEFVARSTLPNQFSPRGQSPPCSAATGFRPPMDSQCAAAAVSNTVREVMATAERNADQLAAAQRRLLELLPLGEDSGEVCTFESLVESRSKRQRRAGPRGKYSPWTGVSQVFKNKVRLSMHVLQMHRRDLLV